MQARLRSTLRLFAIGLIGLGPALSALADDDPPEPTEEHLYRCVDPHLQAPVYTSVRACQLDSNEWSFPAYSEEDGRREGERCDGVVSVDGEPGWGLLRDHQTIRVEDECVVNENTGPRGSFSMGACLAYCATITDGIPDYNKCARMCAIIQKSTCLLLEQWLCHYLAYRAKRSAEIASLLIGTFCGPGL